VDLVDGDQTRPRHDGIDRAAAILDDSFAGIVGSQPDIEARDHS
jgi:hypothetical protein